MKVKDIMTKDIASINANDSIERAAQLMKEYNVGSIPVCSENNVIGIITDRDIAIRNVAEGKSPGQQHVREIMTTAPALANPEMDVHDAARIMSERQIRRLPVVENNNIVGMISLGDLAVDSKLSDNAEDALSNISEPSCPAK